MDIQRRILERVARRYTDLGRRERLHERAERRRRQRGLPRRVLYFHQVDDPASVLTAQVIGGLADRYAIEVVPHLVRAPSRSMIAARHPREFSAWATKDASDIAPHFGLWFPAPGAAPEASRVERGRRILVGCASDDFVRLVSPVTEAVWRADDAALAEIEARAAPASRARTLAHMHRAEWKRNRAGYVYGGSFFYGGEWYPGVDRVPYLEARLTAEGASRTASGASVVERPQERAVALDAAGLTLEFFPSVRSPYSYVAMQRTAALAGRTGIELVCRPVLPILMRGGYSGAFGQMAYVYADAAREAQTYGVGPFDVCECVGRPVEMAYSLFPWARDEGRGFELLHAFTRAVFARRVDAASEAGLRAIVEDAGLPWSAARERLGNHAWKEEIAANLEALYGMGLWGVPSYRLRGGRGADPFHTWGSDRIWLVEREIARRTPGAA